MRAIDGLQARQMARTLFPGWSRSMRARWVVAKLRASPEPLVALSSGWSHDDRAFKFLRVAP